MSLETILWKDFRVINLISLAAIILMVSAAIINFNSTPPKIVFVVGDIIIAILNLAIMIWSIYTQRDARLTREQLDKMMKGEK